MDRLGVLSYHSSPLIEPGRGDAGGMTVYVRALSETLARAGVETDIFTRSESSAVKVQEIVSGVRVISLPAGPTGPLDKHLASAYVPEFAEAVAAFVAAEKIEPDVLHSHYWQSGLAGINLAARWGIPLVHSHHTLGRVKNGFLAPGDRPESDLRLAGEQRVIQQADVLIASTEVEHRQLASLYRALPDRLKTIYPGVDHARFSPGDRGAARRSVGLPQDAAVVLYVGRIQRLKGLDLAVRALEELASALERNTLLVIVGGASGGEGRAEETHLRELAVDLGVDQRVIFAGHQPHDRTVDYYRAADVVAVCSYSESFGLAALEAHACGTPVIGTDVGGLAHVVRDGRSGFLIADRDPSAFAGRAKTILADRALWIEFSKEALRSAVAFTWERTATELLELYECLVTESFPEACTC